MTNRATSVWIDYIIGRIGVTDELMEKLSQ